MNNRKESLALFDQLLIEIDNDLEKYAQPLQVFRDRALLRDVLTPTPDSGLLDETVLAEADRILVTSVVLANRDPRTNGATCTFHPGRLLAIESLRGGLIKRYIGATNRPIVTPDERARLCIADFLACNDACEQFNRDYDPSALPVFVQIVRGEIIDNLYRSLSHDAHVLDVSSVSHHLRAGPGSSAEVVGDPGSYSRLATSSMTFSTPEVRNTYRMCCAANKLSYLAEAVRSNLESVSDLTDVYAKFGTVPKNNEKNRGICSQPSGNMALQLSTHELLSEVLIRQYDCDLENQQFKNRELALLGSKKTFHGQYLSWEFCTVDLTSASDLIARVIITDHFPANWSNWFMHVRSSSVQIELDGEGFDVQKHMISTMGNGFTFSLMTLFFSAIVKVLYSLQGLPEYDVNPVTGERFKTWAVYGDDIIVDKQVFNALNMVLTAFGLKVNGKKTHSTGYFRESCGADYFDGYDVRPVFLETLENEADIYSLLNRLTYWGFRHSVPLPHTLKLLRRSLKVFTSLDCRVPNWEDVSSGIHVPFKLARPGEKPPLGFPNPNKGSRLYKCLTPLLRSRGVFTEKVKRVKYSCIYTRREFCYELTWDVKFKGTPNHPGVLLHMLGGSVRNGRYGVRSEGRTQYEYGLRVAPGWGAAYLIGETAIRPRSEFTQRVYEGWGAYVEDNVF